MDLAAGSGAAIFILRAMFAVKAVRTKMKMDRPALQAEEMLRAVATRDRAYEGRFL